MKTVHSTWIFLWISAIWVGVFSGLKACWPTNPTGVRLTLMEIWAKNYYRDNAEDEGTTIPFNYCYAHRILIDEHSIYTNEDLVHAVDLEVIRDWSNVSSETTSTCKRWFSPKPARARSGLFVERAQIRDFVPGMHIIPYRLGSEVHFTI